MINITVFFFFLGHNITVFSIIMVLKDMPIYVSSNLTQPSLLYLMMIGVAPFLITSLLLLPFVLVQVWTVLFSPTRMMGFLKFFPKKYIVIIYTHIFFGTIWQRYPQLYAFQPAKFWPSIFTLRVYVRFHKSHVDLVNKMKQIKVTRITMKRRKTVVIGENCSHFSRNLEYNNNLYYL